MEKIYTCKCGGLLILDVSARSSKHSLPACKPYLTSCLTARLEGFVSKTDDELHAIVNNGKN